VPTHELPFLAACCGAPIVVEVTDEGNIFSRCACHEIAIENWTSDRNGPSLRSVCTHTAQRRVRLSRRMIQGTGGRIWREVYHSEQGRVFQSGETTFLVSLDSQGGRQIWAGSFEESFIQLTGQPWRPEAS